MREYVICICFAMLFCVGVKILTPSKKYDGIIKIVCGVFVITTIISPLKKFLNLDFNYDYFGDFMKDNEEFAYSVEKSREEFSEDIISYGEKNLSNQISREIEELFADDVAVESYDGKAWRVTDSETENREKIREYIRKTYGCETVFTEVDNGT